MQHDPEQEHFQTSYTATLQFSNYYTADVGYYYSVMVGHDIRSEDRI